MASQKLICTTFWMLDNYWRPWVAVPTRLSHSTVAELWYVKPVARFLGLPPQFIALHNYSRFSLLCANEYLIASFDQCFCFWRRVSVFEILIQKARKLFVYSAHILYRCDNYSAVKKPTYMFNVQITCERQLKHTTQESNPSVPKLISEANEILSTHHKHHICILYSVMRRQFPYIFMHKHICTWIYKNTVSFVLYNSYSKEI